MKKIRKLLDLYPWLIVLVGCFSTVLYFLLWIVSIHLLYALMN